MKRLLRNIIVTTFVAGLLVPTLAFGAAFTATNLVPSLAPWNWNDGGTWLKATESSLTVTVTVSGGNVAFYRSSGNWPANNTWLIFSGFVNNGNNAAFEIVSGGGTGTVTCVKGSSINEGPKSSVTANETFISSPDSPTQGTDYPGTAGDTATVPASSTVTYNLNNTNVLGTVTVNGLLNFSTSMNTELSTSSTLAIGTSGELRVGANDGVNYIPKAYTAILALNNTYAVNYTGNGGKITMVGDPSYYGGSIGNDSFSTGNASAWQAPLATNWTSGATFYVTGNYSNWNVGDCLIVWKNGPYTGAGDTVQVNIAAAGISWNSGTGQTAITVTSAPAFPVNAVSGVSGGHGFAASPYTTYVYNVTRNVRLYATPALVNTDPAMGASSSSNEIRSPNVTSTLSGGFTAHNIEFTGFNRVCPPPGFDIVDSVFRVSLNSGVYVEDNQPGGTASGLIYNVVTGWHAGYGETLNVAIIDTGSGMYAGWGNSNAGAIIDATSVAGLYDTISLTQTGPVAGNVLGLEDVRMNYLNAPTYYNGPTAGGGGAIYACTLTTGPNFSMFANPGSGISKSVMFMQGGKIGYDPSGNSAPNTTYDVDWSILTAQDTVMPLAGLTISTESNASFLTTGRISLVDIETASTPYTLSPGAATVFDEWAEIHRILADGSGAHPSQRAGGAANVLEVTPSSNIGLYGSQIFPIATPLPAPGVGTGMQLYQQADGNSHTYTWYIQTTYNANQGSYTGIPAANLVLTATYNSASSGVTLSTVTSTQHIVTRANAADWSQKVSVTVPSLSQASMVTFNLQLKGYEAAGHLIWVDPAPMVQ